MDTLPGAVSLARALLSLTRSRRTGVLHVMTELGGCRLTIVAGLPRAAGPLAFEDPAEDLPAYGDALEPSPHVEALHASLHVHGPVGHWLVEAGSVERPARELALRRQLRDRVLHVFACQTLEFRFDPRAPAEDEALIEEPICAADLLLAALRAQVAQLPGERLFAAVDRGELRLNALGSMLTREAALWPEEAAALSLLAEGGSLVRLLQMTVGSDRTLRFLAGLSLLSAVSAVPGRDQRLSLLVRKSERLRRAASAHTLREPERAEPDDAEPRLHRSARILLPDAPGREGADALQHAPGEALDFLA
jgi:hypothetical protein